MNAISCPQAIFFNMHSSTKFTNYSRSPGRKLISTAKSDILFLLEYLLVKRISSCPHKSTPASSSQNFSHLSTLLFLSIVHTLQNENYTHFLKSRTKLKRPSRQICHKKCTKMKQDLSEYFSVPKKEVSLHIKF